MATIEISNFAGVSRRPASLGPITRPEGWDGLIVNETPLTTA